MKRFRMTALVLCLLLLVPFIAAAEPVSSLRVRLYGDVDGNDIINTTDARRILQIVAGKDIAVAYPTAADFDRDYRVDTTDARRVLQYTVGTTTLLPTPLSLPYTRLDTAPGGESVPFTVRETTYSHIRDYDADAHDIVVIRSSEEWATVRAANEFQTTYDDAFFAQNAVIVFDVSMTGYNYRLDVRDIVHGGKTLAFSLDVFNPNEWAQPALRRALAVVEVPRQTLDGVDELALYLT